MIMYIHKFIQHTTCKLTRDKKFEYTGQPFSPGNLVDKGLHEHDLREPWTKKWHRTHQSNLPPFQNQVIFTSLIQTNQKGKEIQIPALKTYRKHYFLRPRGCKGRADSSPPPSPVRKREMSVRRPSTPSCPRSTTSASGTTGSCSSGSRGSSSGATCGARSHSCGGTASSRSRHRTRRCTPRRGTRTSHPDCRLPPFNRSFFFF